MEMVRALLDSMIFDEIVADAQFKADVLKAIGAGDLVIVTTHIQQDQLASIPDQAKRVAIASIPRTALPTGAVVWDSSRWDEAKFDDGVGPVKLGQIFRGNVRDIPDALIATTLDSADVLVTEDKKLAKRVAVASPKLHWSLSQFKAFVGSKV